MQPGPGCEFGQARRVRNEGAEGEGVVAWIVARDEQAAHLVHNRRPKPADCGGHDGGATRLCFDRNESKGLRVGGNDGDIRGAIPVGQQVAVPRWLKAHDVVDTQLVGQVHEGGRVLKART